MKKVLLIGSTCVDVIIRLDHLPQRAEDLQPESQSFSLGGCAYNAASILRQAGCDFTFITPVGCGLYGDFVADALKKQGFPLTVRLSDQENGCCYCLVERNGERTFLSLHRAEYTFSKSWMTPLNETFFDMIYVCGLEIEEPTGGELVSYLEERKQKFPAAEIFFAPGPRILSIKEELMERLMALHPVLHLNEDEAFSVTGCKSLKEAASRLFSRTGNSVIITLGEQGAYCLEQNDLDYEIPSAKALVTDTIGAGDSHIGSLLAGLSLGYSMKESLSAASIISGAVVAHSGSVLPDQVFQEINPFLR